MKSNRTKWKGASTGERHSVLFTSIFSIFKVWFDLNALIYWRALPREHGYKRTWNTYSCVHLPIPNFSPFSPFSGSILKRDAIDLAITERERVVHCVFIMFFCKKRQRLWEGEREKEKERERERERERDPHRVLGAVWNQLFPPFPPLSLFPPHLDVPRWR